jgi:hypothetical protein
VLTGTRPFTSHAVANLANNAQSRYDIGVWVADPTDKSAMSAHAGEIGTAAHELPALQPRRGRARRIELGARGLAGRVRRHVAGHRLGTLDLEVLQVTCKANAATVAVNSCIGWQNSDDFTDRGFCRDLPRLCGAQGFRLEPCPNGVEV